jgi:hypothetical protein
MSASGWCEITSSIGSSPPDDDSARAQFTGAANEFCQEVERIGAHFRSGGGDIDVDIGHVDGDQPQPLFAETAARLELFSF